ncbi:MAG: exonuclease SbcCD subunit D [Clostridia bacterium]|nr:exonuclease SbcCD subunit D [Clostridia bacterium]
MKLFHISDLHLGKRLNEFSLIDDQKYILDQILKLSDELKPEGIIIAGDIYDRAAPSAEAINLFSSFLTRISERKLKFFAISGNHDSPERVSYGGKILKNAGLYFSDSYDGKICPITLSDEFGEINFYLLPFVRPAVVRAYADEETKIDSFNDAVEYAVKCMNVNPKKRNVLVAHQYVTGAASSGSEESIVGGLDNIEASLFDDFDYVALGHIHGAQSVKRDAVRYSGTPLKYSLSEVNHKKTITVIELKEKGNIEISEVPLEPLHDLVELRGTYDNLSNQKFDVQAKNDDYIKIILTDEIENHGALSKLRHRFPHLLALEYDNAKTRFNGMVSIDEKVQEKSPVQLVEDLYKKQMNLELTDEQRKYLLERINEIWEGEE